MKKSILVSFAVFACTVFSLNAQQPIEIEDYNNAIKANTVEAYSLYLEHFGDEPRAYQPYVNDIRERLDRIKKENADNRMWEQALAEDTEQAYNRYIAEAPLGIHVEEARKAIDEYDVKKEWQPLSKSTNIDALQEFELKYAKTKYSRFSTMARERIQKINMDNALAEINSHPKDTFKMKEFLRLYPQSPDFDKVYVKLHLTEANNFYSQERYAWAKANFDLAAQKTTLSDSDKWKRREAEAYIEYDKNSYRSPGQLANFAKTYSGTRKGNEASDNLARYYARDIYCKGEDWHGYSYNDAYDKAKRYAKSNSTYSYIDRKAKAAARRYNGGLFNMALGFEGGYSVLEDDKAWYANGLVGLRIGNYRDVVQFDIGVSPGVFSCYEETEFQLPAYASLKLSMFRGGLYLRLGGSYQLINSDYLGKYALRVGFGSAFSKHFEWDWACLQYNPDCMGEDCLTIGMRMTFYITR